MPSLETPEHPLVGMLNQVYAQLIENGAVDVVLAEDQAVEIQADEWTLHLEGWPVTSGWIALDETPVSAKEQLLALDAALGARDLAALREANLQLEGAIAAALEDSGDPLSEVLASLLGDTDDDEMGADGGDVIQLEP